MRICLAGKRPIVQFICCSPSDHCITQALRLQQTYEAHSGYCFAGTFLDRIGLAHSTDAAHHDYHHSVNRGNFGTIWMVCTPLNT
jgi:sterol desaturase/sphingolipid hydroxylase (fatty acid hydroxylase superfamily)